MTLGYDDSTGTLYSIGRKAPQFKLKPQEHFGVDRNAFPIKVVSPVLVKILRDKMERISIPRPKLQEPK